MAEERGGGGWAAGDRVALRLEIGGHHAQTVRGTVRAVGWRGMVFVNPDHQAEDHGAWFEPERLAPLDPADDRPEDRRPRPDPAFGGRAAFVGAPPAGAPISPEDLEAALAGIRRRTPAE